MTSNPPRSPALEVPRKSVEMQDPGAHDLDSSSDDGQVFSDAPDTIQKSLPPLTIPITRVEKVDNSPSHGEVPGTPAYDKRTQDAVPDEIEIIPDGQRSRASSRAMRSPSSAGHSPVPQTRVEKIDPTSPSYGEVRGTPAWEKRRADAMPDEIEIASPGSRSPSALPQSPIPRTVVTRVDSEPAHGEVPEGEESSQSYFRRVIPNQANKGSSPIAEDGGFGPMEDESSQGTNENQANDDDNDGFDDFAEGNEGDDEFGDFDDFEDGFEDDGGGTDDKQTHTKSATVPAQQAIAIEPPPFPVLDFSSPYSLESLITAIEPHSTHLFPAIHDQTDDPPSALPDSNSAFLTDRSLSLWQQLVAPPPLQPPNWVRSRIRRLFLVSLGVPVDLDEILPKSKQKKLVLQYKPSAQKGNKRASLTTKADDGSSTPTDNDPSATTSTSTSTNLAGGKSIVSKKRRGPAPPPDFDTSEVHELCHKTAADHEAMTDGQLQSHVKRLEELCNTGKDVLQYWVRRKEAAVGEKEAFDGVIENLVRHARRVRK